MSLMDVFSDHLLLPKQSGKGETLAIPALPGVYAITSATGEIIQLLSSQNIRRSAMLRLRPEESGASARRAELQSVSHAIWWTRTYSPFETSLRHLEIAPRLFGDTYRKHTSLPACWYAKTKLIGDFPLWIATTAPFDSDTVTVGPFSSRIICTRFIKDIEDLFGLCRDHTRLKIAPFAQRCSYYDMGKCTGACDGTQTKSDYNEVFAQSVTSVIRKNNDYETELTDEMNLASTKLNFEIADTLKHKLDLLHKVRKTKGQIAITPHDMRYLVLQRGQRPTLIRPFFVNAGAVTQGTDRPLDQIEQAAEDWANFDWSSDNVPREPVDRREQVIKLLCHYLGKGKKAGGVFINAANTFKSNDIISIANNAFQAAKPK